MSYDPFDGVLLNDPRPPVSGAVGLMMHLRVVRRLAKAKGRTAGPGLEALKGRAQACRELLAQGLLPSTLRELQKYGLDLGFPKAAHSLASVLAHLEAYLKEVESGGYLEPDLALWHLELAG